MQLQHMNSDHNSNNHQCNNKKPLPKSGSKQITVWGGCKAYQIPIQHAPSFLLWPVSKTGKQTKIIAQIKHICRQDNDSRPPPQPKYVESCKVDLKKNKQAHITGQTNSVDTQAMWTDTLFTASELTQAQLAEHGKAGSLQRRVKLRKIPILSKTWSSNLPI
jgi:hypothetical protein